MLPIAQARLCMVTWRRYGAVAEAAAAARAHAPPPAQRELAWTPAQREAARRAYMAGPRMRA